MHYKGWFFHEIFDNIHLKSGKTKKKKKPKLKKTSIFGSPLIVNKFFSRAQFIIGKSDFAHIMHFQ